MASSMQIADVLTFGSKEAEEADKALKSALLSCANDPDFAVICDFLQKFSKDLGLDLPNFKLLLQWLTKTDEVSPQLRDMQIKLLRKTRKIVHEKSWESALSKFCFTYSAQDGWEIERFGYKNSNVKVKLRILRELLECQFERNSKFRSKILTLSADSLRSKPIGRDRQGHAYWVTQDNDCNIRIYQEHLDDDIWQVVATNRDEFVNLLKRLKRSEVVQPCEDIDIVDEDTTSNSSHIDSITAQKDCPPQESNNTPQDEQKIPKLSIKLAMERNSKETTHTKYLGKGEEELAAEEDAKLLKKSNSAAPESGEEEFEEVEEECEEESGSDSGSGSDTDNDDIKNLNDDIKNLKSKETERKPQKDLKSDDANKKVEPLLISQKKILNMETSLTLSVGKKRTLDEKTSVLPLKNDNQQELKKLKTSLPPSEAEKDEKTKQIKESKDSIENDEVDEEMDEEDIDSVAAEEDENEEKLFEDYDDDDEEAEVGEEITDPIVKVVGEGSGKDCKMENYLYCTEYDSDNCNSPPLGDIIIEDVFYVYGEGSGKECLVGNKKAEDCTANAENVTLNSSKTSTEEKSESQCELTGQKIQNNSLEQTNDIKLSTSTKSVPDKDNIKDTDKTFENINNKEKISDKDTEKSSENCNDTKDVDSQQEVNNVTAEKSTKDTNKTQDILNSSGAKNPVVEKTETVNKEDNNILEKDMKNSNMNSKALDESMQQAHASKMSALESLKKELRESKQKLLEKKLPPKVETCDIKAPNTSIYNRKRRFTDQTQPTSTRPTNSESEIDLNSENNEEISHEKELEIVESEQFVGGKRIKMRPKQANFELRKKIEALKVAAKEETTSSSSGEEELRKQRKIISPKQSKTSESSEILKSETNLEKFYSVKDEITKKDNDEVLIKKELESRTIVPTKRLVPTKPTKVKATLAEIIEKKLKKTPEKNQSDASTIDKNTNKETPIQKHAIPSFNKSPITKPLKKNVLIQIRQEANEDEVPRKRCNSQDTNQIILSASKSLTSTTKESEQIDDFEEQIKINTVEKQRKRRSSEEIDQNDIHEKPEAKKEVIKEKPTLKRDKPNDTIKKEVTKDELKDDPQKKPKQISARRPTRKGGLISPPKKNRSSLTISKEKIESNNSAKLKLLSNNTKKCDENKESGENIKSDSTASPLKENDIKEVKSNTNLGEKTAKTESNLTPKTPVKGARKLRDVDTTNIIDVDSETPVRQSRRIAQQKIREEAERRKLEEIALRTMKQELKKKKKAEKEADPTIAPPTEPSSSESEESDVEIKRKSQKKKFPGKNGNWSSGSEEQEEPEEDYEEHHRYETDPGSPLFKSDHEFSPESDIEDESQAVPMKRARTVRKEDADVDGSATNKEEWCQKCNKSDHPEWILLCDNCDKGYHCSCLSPVLFYIPEGDWYCPPCQQEQLIKALENQLKEFDDLVENKRKKEEDEKRIAEEEKVRKEKEEENNKSKPKKDKNTKKSDNVSSSDDHSQESNDDEGSVKNSNGIKKTDPKNQSKQKGRSRNYKNSYRSRRNRHKNRGNGSESDSQHSSKSTSVSKSDSSSSSTYSESDNEPIYKLRKRRQINVSYRLNEYDDLINSALKKEMDEVAGAGNLGRGKDISTIIEADKEEKARQKQIEDGGEVVKTQKENNNVEEKQQGSLDTKLNDPGKKEGIKKEESDSDAEPIIRKLNIKPSNKKKSRKLTTLDISSEDDDGSDEDFKGSSIDDDEEEEDTSVSASNSDSSLEIYKKHKKKRRKAARRASRQRRRERRFLVDESDDEEVQRPKSKKKRKDESDYTESEADDDDISDLSENIDSADLCDDTTTDESDGAWRPNKSKKAKKSAFAPVQKSPKLKNSHKKKPKKVEYSDDDVSESEEEEEEDDDVGGSGKGYGKQPRSQPLKKPTNYTPKTKGKGKEKPVPKSKNKNSSDDESSRSNSEDSTRRTRGRRYAYIEDFDDDSSDGGIKPGVQRPDTPPEEREKFIKRQEEIKRMLAEKNAEGAKLAATPRLTPIKTDGEKDKQKTPVKAGGDSLSTVPLSVIRQAKVLDIDYLQRRGENLDDLSNEVGDVDDDFDDADLPDDLPEDMDEDTIARMVEEDEEFAANAAKELPAQDEILRSPISIKPIKTKEVETPILLQTPSNSFTETTNKITTMPTSTPILQEPIRKRLPMPTMHPPLLRHHYLMHESLSNSHNIMHRQGGPPTSHLLQNALSAPLSQPLDRNYPSSTPPSPHHSLINRVAHSIPLQSTVAHALNTTRPPHAPPLSLITSKPSTQTDRPTQEKPINPQNFTENKPRGRRKKITPLRDTLQKQQTAAAVTAATATNSALSSALLKNSESLSSSVIKSAPSQKLQVQHNTLNSMQPTSHSPACRPTVPMAPIRVPYIGTDAGPRFYDVLGNRAQQSGIHRHRGPSQLPPSLLPPPPANRSSYGPPPPLKGSNSGPPPGSSASGPIRNPMQHIPPPYLGMPPNARHASHLNMYSRPPIYGNPNFGPRSSLRPPNIHVQEFTPGSRAYPPYGFYPPPPPLTTPGGHRPGPVPISRTSTQIPPNQSTSVIVSSKSSNSPSVTPKHDPTPIPEITDSCLKSIAVKKEFLIKSSSPKSLSPKHVIDATGKSGEGALSVAEPRKKLTTLQAYNSDTSKKSPVLPVSDSSGSRSPPNPSTRVNDDSTVVATLEANPTVEQLASKEGKASEFSGLVSYFSSQHDDYNT